MVLKHCVYFHVSIVIHNNFPRAMLDTIDTHNLPGYSEYIRPILLRNEQLQIVISVTNIFNVMEMIIIFIKYKKLDTTVCLVFTKMCKLNSTVIAISH